MTPKTTVKVELLSVITHLYDVSETLQTTVANKIVTLQCKRSFLWRSSPRGSIIFLGTDYFVGLSVLCSNWSFGVHILRDTAEIA